jgi:hypothetical protein
VAQKTTEKSACERMKAWNINGTPTKLRGRARKLDPDRFQLAQERAKDPAHKLKFVKITKPKV